MTSRRIIYVLEPFSNPFGGVAIIYRHAEILMAHGFSAFVHLPELPAVDFYDSSAQLLLGNLTLRTNDILVIPEILHWALRQFASLPIRRLMFCQSLNPPPLQNPRNALAQWGVHGVIASSVAIQDYLQSRYGLSNVPILPCAVDSRRFAPAKNKKCQIAVMPRKLPGDAAAIEAEFKRRHRQFSKVPWVSIDRVSQIEAAQVLNESSVFLSLSHQDAFGLPPLEAMTSGCLVAGYHGGGGREYISPLNGWWAEAGDLLTCVDGLAAALDLLGRGGAELEARRRAMMETVGRYSPQHMEAMLLNFWHRELLS